MVGDVIPKLEGQAAEAVGYRGGHLQIIASAGAGKTEVVSQRVAGLLADGCPPTGIVAFTFTERAAESLKSRIEKRVSAHPKLGQDFLDLLNGMFVGTIHSYCFQVLQRYVTNYETFDVLDDHRLTAFLARYEKPIGLKELNTGGKYRSIKAFVENLSVVENELLEPGDLEDPFREVYERYLAVLLDNRFLTYGQIVAKAVEHLRDPEIGERVHGPLRHLIVDEYQDINPAQEALIEILASSPVQLCVVGDDDQSIYQWRGSDVGNIQRFDRRYKPVKRFWIEENWRSRPQIVEVANAFAKSIEHRIEKTMKVTRASTGVPEVVCWKGETPENEAQVIAAAVVKAKKLGYRYKDIAILCRGRVSFGEILRALEGKHVPVQPGGRTNLFMKDDARLFGMTVCWLADIEWREGDIYQWTDVPVTLNQLVADYTQLYDLIPAQANAVRRLLRGWKASVEDPSSPANLVRDFYELMGEVGVAEWDMSDPWVVNRLGTLARCSQLLVDYESTKRRARPDHSRPGEMTGGQDRGPWYYFSLATFLLNWALGSYEDFEGEEDVELDAVDLTTVHQAKGLEWPIVFVPALKSDRFPSRKTGSARNWLIPTELFSRERYEGTVTDERRLFYVAMTRAREFLSLSTFERMNRACTTSPFLVEVADIDPPRRKRLSQPPPPAASDAETEILEVAFSDLAAYAQCGLAYRYRRLIGFQPPIAAEIGYGKAVHHILRRVAEHVQRTGKKPSEKQLDQLFDDDFYLPAANRQGYRQMKSRARKLVDRYIDEWQDELQRVWEVERPFELHLGDATVFGRADVITTQGYGSPPRLTIVDYKTAADGHDMHDFQLQVYTDAGRREQLIVESAFVHDLKRAERRPVPVSDGDVDSAEERARTILAKMRAKDYPGISDPKVCGRCDVRAFCGRRAD